MTSGDRRGRSPPSTKVGTSGGDKMPSPKGKSPLRTPSPIRSPPRRSHTRDARPRREVVVERVIRESGGAGNWPQLTKTNYDSWALLMKLKLQARHLWQAVEDGDVEFHDDRTALEAICSAVPPELVPTLATKPSAKAAWKAIRMMRDGDERVQKSTAQNLRTEYEQIAFRDGESVEDFALRLSNIMQRLAILGDPEPEAKVLAKYLRVARPRYRQLVVSIETLLDIDTLSAEEVTGRLKGGHRRRAGTGADHRRQALPHGGGVGGAATSTRGGEPEQRRERELGTPRQRAWTWRTRTRQRLRIVVVLWAGKTGKAEQGPVPPLWWERALGP
jgi:hypothetical protein